MNVPMLAILLPMLIILNGFVIDVGRYLVARAELQTIVDASSLAGAMAAEAIPEKELEVETDDSGNLSGIKEKSKEYRIVINPVKAREDALETAELNGSPDYWKGQGGIFALDQAPLNNEPGWEGSVIGDDSYYTRARVWMKPGFFAPVIKAVTGRDYVPVYIDSTSQAVNINEN